MASGCIITLNCPVCDKIVWEDNWYIDGYAIIHATCHPEYLKRKYHITDKQVSRLYGAQKLRAEILAIRQASEEHQQWTEQRATELEQKLAALERRKSQ